MNEQQFKPGRRARKQLAKYGINFHEFVEAAYEEVYDYLEVCGDEEMDIDNFERRDNHLYVSTCSFSHNGLLDDNDGSCVWVVFEAIPHKKSKDKFSIKITNIKKDGK